MKLLLPIISLASARLTKVADINYMFRNDSVWDGMLGDLADETKDGIKMIVEFDDHPEVDPFKNKEVLRVLPSGYLEMLQPLRRLKQLKSLILHLQPEHRFARYCYYGCWCIADKAHDFHNGQAGVPVDPIDSSCKRQYQCYECAKMDHPNRNCDSSITQYHYNLLLDDTDPNNHWKKSIQCTDPADRNEKFSCRRAMCECDKRLAEDLRTHFDEWSVDNHKIQGNFNADVQCVKNPSGGNNEGPIECCGDYPNRFPFSTQGGNRQCCSSAGKTYNPTVNECCGDSVEGVGNCPTPP